MSLSSPALSQEAFDRLFDACDRQRLVNDIRKQHAKTYNFLISGGFQLSPQNVLIYKKRLRQKLPALGQEMLLIPTLAAEGSDATAQLAELLCEIPEDMLRKFWKQAIRVAQKPAIFALALYTFPQKSWQHKLATRLLKCATPWQDRQPSPQDQQPESQDSAIIGWIKTLADIFLEPGHRQDTPEQQRHTQNTEDLVNARLAEEIKKLKAQQEAEDIKAHKKRKVELQQTKRELDNAQKTIQDLTRQLEQTRQQAAKDLEEQKIRLENQYNESHEQFLQQTLKVDHQLQKQADEAQSTTDKLLRKIQDATFQQRALNKNHGSKHALRTQRQQLMDALKNLQLAADDSFVTVRDLKTIIAQTNRQISDINRMLAEDDDHSVPFSLLEAHIQAIAMDANADKRLHDTLDFIQEALNHEILQEKETEQLEELVQRRMSLLRNFRLKPLEKSLQNMKTEKPARGPREIWYLAQQLDRLRKVTLIFDGYNAMIRNKIWTDMADTKTFPVARQHFIDRIKAKHALFKRVEIIFDGNSTTDTVETVTENLKVVYAAKICDAHNADDYIVRRAKELHNAHPEEPIWVVTNDYGLRTRLDDFCQAYVETSTIPDFFLA